MELCLVPLRKLYFSAILFLFLGAVACSPRPQFPVEAINIQNDIAARVTRKLDIVRTGSNPNKLVKLNGTVPLLDGDVVQVTDGGEAVLDFGNFLQMRLFNDTRLNVVKVISLAGAPLDVSLYLEAGGFTGNLTQSGGQAEYWTPGGARITVLGTEYFVVYDPLGGITSVGNFQGTVMVEAGGVIRTIPDGFLVEVPKDGQPGPEVPILFTRKELDGRARALQSPILALQEITADPTITATSGDLSPTPTASPSATLTSTFIPTLTQTFKPTPSLTKTPTRPPLPTETKPPPLATFTKGPPAGNCHPSYPDFCIPPPPPYLDCSDIGRKRFKVLPPDPHNFDGDNNGIGCQ